MVHAWPCHDHGWAGRAPPPSSGTQVPTCSTSPVGRGCGEAHKRRTPTLPSPWLYSVHVRTVDDNVKLVRVAGRRGACGSTASSTRATSLSRSTPGRACTSLCSWSSGEACCPAVATTRPSIVGTLVGTLVGPSCGQVESALPRRPARAARASPHARARLSRGPGLWMWTRVRLARVAVSFALSANLAAH